MANGFGYGFGFGVATNRIPNEVSLTWLNQVSAFDFNASYREFGSNNSQVDNNWNVRNIWTQNTVSGTSWECEFQIINSIQQTVFGITESSNSLTVNGYTDINFAVILQGGSAVLSYENGSVTGANTTYSIGDKFKIIRSGSIVSFYKNGVFGWNFLGSPISSTYKIKLSQRDVDGYNHILRINYFQ